MRGSAHVFCFRGRVGRGDDVKTASSPLLSRRIFSKSTAPTLDKYSVQSGQTEKSESMISSPHIHPAIGFPKGESPFGRELAGQRLSTFPNRPRIFRRPVGENEKRMRGSAGVFCFRGRVGCADDLGTAAVQPENSRHNATPLAICEQILRSHIAPQIKTTPLFQLRNCGAACSSMTILLYVPLPIIWGTSARTEQQPALRSAL